LDQVFVFLECRMGDFPGDPQNCRQCGGLCRQGQPAAGAVRHGEYPGAVAAVVKEKWLINPDPDLFCFDQWKTQ
jgi:hypothetical protein